MIGAPAGSTLPSTPDRLPTETEAYADQRHWPRWVARLRKMNESQPLGTFCVDPTASRGGGVRAILRFDEVLEFVENDLTVNLAFLTPIDSFLIGHRDDLF